MKFTVKIKWNEDHEHVEIEWIKIGDRIIQFLDSSEEADFIRSFLFIRRCDDGMAISVIRGTLEEWVHLATQRYGKVVDDKLVTIEFKIPIYPWHLSPVRIWQDPDGWWSMECADDKNKDWRRFGHFLSRLQAEMFRLNLFQIGTEIYFIRENSRVELLCMLNRTYSFDEATEEAAQKEVVDRLLIISAEHMRWKFNKETLPALIDDSASWAIDFRPLPDYQWTQRFYAVQAVYEGGYRESKVVHQEVLVKTIEKMFSAVKEDILEHVGFIPMAKAELEDPKAVIASIFEPFDDDLTSQASIQTSIENLTILLKRKLIRMSPFHTIRLIETGEPEAGSVLPRDWVENTLKTCRGRVKRYLG